MGCSLSHLPLLSDDGCVIFQVPGGENGWSNVQQAVEGLGLGSGLGWVVTEVVSDERGVKRCVIVEREKGTGKEKVKEKGKEKVMGKEVSREKKVSKTTTKVVLKKTKTKESL